MSEMELFDFAMKLGEMAFAADEITKHVLKDAGKIVQKEAKQEIGHYQDGAGPFVAWAELADSTKADRVNLGYTENDPGLRSGKMRDSIEFTVKSDLIVGEVQIGSNDDKMVWFELGTSKQPPRSALGGAMFRKTPELIALIGASAEGVLLGRGVVEGGINALSE